MDSYNQTSLKGNVINSYPKQILMTFKDFKNQVLIDRDQACNTLYKAYKNNMLAATRNLTWDANHKDYAFRAVSAVWEKTLSDSGDIKNMKSYLTTVARNELKKDLGLNNGISSIDDEKFDNSILEAVEEESFDPHLLEAIKHCVKFLENPKLIKNIKLFFLQNYCDEAIARELDYSNTKTPKTLRNRAMDIVRNCVYTYKNK